MNLDRVLAAHGSVSAQHPVVEPEAPRPAATEAASQSIDVKQPVVETAVVELEADAPTIMVETAKKSTKENLPERTALP